MDISVLKVGDFIRLRCGGTAKVTLIQKHSYGDFLIGLDSCLFNYQPNGCFMNILSGSPFDIIDYK